MAKAVWDIRRRGRRWRGPEARARYHLSPEKIEIIEGRLFWSRRDRMTMHALLLENAGADAAVRLGDPQVWRDAVAALDRDARKAGQVHEGPEPGIA